MNRAFRTTVRYAALAGLACLPYRSHALDPIPDKLVVLTFDDSVKSHATYVAPLLKKLGFGATFFITEGFDFETNKTQYMTWDEIRGLHDMGFEIGNHTRRHKGVSEQTREEFGADLEHIEKRCHEYGIPRPITFAYPGNALSPESLGVLKQRNYLFARRGGSPEWHYKEGRGTAYNPREDHPLLIPSAGDARPEWTLGDFKQAVDMAHDGRIAVMQFHGVPEIDHPWVHTDPGLFAQYMSYLEEEAFHVVALRDLRRYVDPSQVPANPFAVIQARGRANTAASKP